MPMEILDRVWDAYMDRSLPDQLREAGTARVPNLVQLPGIDTHHLSALFDLAISVYRDEFGGGAPYRSPLSQE
jgi:hypothetical protein